MSKTISGLLGISKNVNKGRALRITIGITTLFLIISCISSATPINDCTTISSPGSYVLAKNIGNSANSVFCISITSSDVVFDGAGYMINGTDAQSTTYGVYVYNPATVLTNVTLKNLIVKEWKVGINYSNVKNGIIVDNNVSTNFYEYLYEAVGISLSSSSDITISDNIANSTWGGSGISLKFSNDNTISDNNASKNSDGISLKFSNNNTISGNSADSNNDNGIILTSSNYNTLSGNNAYNSRNHCGIILEDSSHNTLIGNNATNNVDGIVLESSITDDTLSRNNTISRNNAISNYEEGIYLRFSSNNTISENNFNSNHGEYHGYGIFLSFSNNNTLDWNNANSNIHGITVEYSRDDMFRGNNDSNNRDSGIVLTSSSNNIFDGNNVSTGGIGISLSYSDNNTIYNNIFDNTNNYNSFSSSNIWNITRKQDINIVGGSYLGGNVWAYPSGTGYSQTCNDVDGDGICDSSRTLDVNNVDYLPLVYREAITPTPTATSTPTVTATPTPTLTVTATPTPTPTPTTHFTPEVAAWDTNHDDVIQKSEAVNAVVAYFSGTITKANAVSVVIAYFGG